MYIIQRAGLVVRLELVEGEQFGFNMSADKGAIVGWPQRSSLIGSIGTLEYPSDIVQFGIRVPLGRARIG